VGILAAVGISQYSATVEKSRLAEAKVRIGVMRQLAYQYWLEKGDMTNITNADVGVDGSCSTGSFYSYDITVGSSVWVGLNARRCTSGGKAPNISTRYSFYYWFFPDNSHAGGWGCQYDDTTSCFGLPTAPYN